MTCENVNNSLTKLATICGAFVLLFISFEKLTVVFGGGVLSNSSLHLNSISIWLSDGLGLSKKNVVDNVEIFTTAAFTSLLYL